MKRATPAVLVLAACAGAPPPAPAPKPAPPPPAEAQTLEIQGPKLTARAAFGKPVFRVELSMLEAAVLVPGGAVALAGGHLVRLDGTGAVQWKVPFKGHGRLAADAGLLRVSTRGRVAFFEVAGGGERGSVAVDEAGIEGEGPEGSFRVPLRLFPGAAWQKAERAVAVGPDGTILVGASDGSLLSFDPRGNPRFQTAIRGAVRDLEARPDGSFAVRTPSGTALIGPGGVRREAPPQGRPSLAFRIRPNLLQQPPLDKLEVASALHLARDDVWALAGDYDHRAVYHHDGKAWKVVPTPGVHPLDPSCWMAGGPDRERACRAAKGGRDEVLPSRLVRSPEGELLLLGLRRVPMPYAPGWASVELTVFQRDGKAFRPHPRLGKALGKTRVEMGGHGGIAPTYAAGPGGREVICQNGECLARGLPPTFRFHEDNAPPEPAGPPGWLHLPGGSAFLPVSFAFGGQALFCLDGRGLSREGEVLDPDAATERYNDLWASAEDDVWAVLSARSPSDPSFVVRWDGRAATRAPSPVPLPEHVWGTARDDVWIAGDTSAAHWDGHAYTAISGVSGPIVGVGREEAWIGRWSVSRDAPAPDLTASPAPLPPPVSASRPLAVGPADPSITVDPAALRGFPGALGLARGPDGRVWIHDTRRAAILVGGVPQLAHAGEPGAPLRCQRCLAPGGEGRDVLLLPGTDGKVSLLRLTAPEPTVVTRAPALLAAARSPSGAVWAVGAAEDDAAPRALVSTPAGLRLVDGLPAAAYADVAPFADDDVWIAGGLSAFSDGTRAWPAGEGLLIHFDGRAFTRHRAPDGALHAVAAVGPGEAWAAGAGGGLLHVRGGAAEAFHLDDGRGNPLRITLRAVAASGPDDVWIAGEGATLLRWDGKELRRVDTRAAGGDAAFAAVLAPAGEPGWLAGPSGVWRVRRAP